MDAAAFLGLRVGREVVQLIKKTLVLLSSGCALKRSLAAAAAAAVIGVAAAAAAAAAADRHVTARVIQQRSSDGEGRRGAKTSE